jgi:signal transduction histidine kinase
LIVRDGDAWSDIDGGPVTGDGLGQTLPIDAEGTEVARLLYLGDPETAVRVSERLRDVIDRAVLELTVRAQQRRLTEERLRAETAVVDERHRMERDLHDGVQGKLLGLALNLQSAQRVLDDPQAQLVLDDAVHDLRGAIEELRLLASGQLPERLSRQGLGSALEVLLAKLPLDVDVSIPESRLPSEIETLAYFVIGEAVTNAAKHAACTRVAVEVTCQDESVRIRISDDGCGGADSRMGSGLKGLRERVHAAGGELMLREALPHGTELVAVVPLSRRSTATLEPSIVR